MDSLSPPPGTPQQPKSGYSFSSLTGWWPRRWVPNFFSAGRPASSPTAPPSFGNSPLTKDQSTAFEVDEGSSTPNTPVPPLANSYAHDGLDSSNKTNCVDASAAAVPAVSFPVHAVQHRTKELADAHFADSTASLVASAGGKRTPANTTLHPSAAGVAHTAFTSSAVEPKMPRFASTASTNGSSSVGVAADSSASTTPRPGASAASTPRLLTPSMGPLSEEVYAVKPWSTILSTTGPSLTAGHARTGSGVHNSVYNVNSNASTANSFLLPAAVAASDALAAEQMRTPPACVELPGPQSLFVRGGTASGCDSRSIGLLQKSVLAEQRSLPSS